MASETQIKIDSESASETYKAAALILRRAGFFTWGHDSWCHDEGGIGCVTTAEALELVVTDERIGDILRAKIGTGS